MKIKSRWQWVLQKLSQTLWLTIIAYSFAAVLAVFLASYMQSLIPFGFRSIVSLDSVKQLLNILASSMLAVTTFSLTTMVSANNSVKSSISPRASMLLINDSITRNALGAFMGGFIFSIIGVVSINANIYGEHGHIIIFLATILVIFIILAFMLRWINYLMDLGKVGIIFDMIECEVETALKQYVEDTSLGCNAFESDKQKELENSQNRINAKTLGYIQHIDIIALNQIAESHDIDLYINVSVGDFVTELSIVLYFEGQLEEKHIAKIIQCFSINKERTYNYDPLYGIMVLTEIASRALSPSINDSNTAIDIISRLHRLIENYIFEREQIQKDKSKETHQTMSKNSENDETQKRVWLKPLLDEDIIRHAFHPIARDGRDKSEIHRFLQLSFSKLYVIDSACFREVIQETSRYSMAYLDNSVLHPMDKKEIEAIASRIV